MKLGMFAAAASFCHSSTLIWPALFAKLVKCIIAVCRAERFLEVVARLDFDELHASAAKLVIERIAMRLLNDDFRLHSGEIGSWRMNFSLSFVSTPASPDRMAPAAPDVTIAV